MNKIGLKEIVSLCVKDPHGYTPREAFELMSFCDQKGYWSLDVHNAQLWLVHHYKKRQRVHRIPEQHGHFSHLDILRAVSSCYGVEVNVDNPSEFNEWKAWLRTLDFSKPTLRLVT